MQATIRDDFVRAFHDDQVWIDTTWLGTPVVKPPTDLWMYQELFCRLRPTAIIETGTECGGSALFYACVLDWIGGAGDVWTIDVQERRARPTHPRLHYVAGDSADPAVYEAVMADVHRAAATSRCFVILDSDHRPAHVTRELALWAPVVTRGCYCVVEDTMFGGHPVAGAPELAGGPWPAVEAFLRTPLGADFRRDPACERFGLTFAPGGWLERRTA